MKKDIYITGGSGFIGSKLIEHWQTSYNVKALSRSSGLNRIVYPESAEDFAELIDGSEALVNLAGASIVGKSWTDSYKQELRDSRINITKLCAEAIDLCDNPPKIFISASAIGYYGDRGDEELTEESQPANGFVADLCKDWESSAEIQNLKTKLFIPRIGIVLDKGFGALSKMEAPFKLFVGGPVGSGMQWFSWIDIDDLVGIFDWAIKKEAHGVFNVTSPNPVRMEEFSKALGWVLNRPSWFKVPEFMLKLILGESAQEVTRSQKVLPNKVVAHGYKYKYDDLRDSLGKIFRR
jgi:hypothetical protein